VLTGSTNFSITGIYVNANHVLVFDDPDVAQTYADAFDVMFEDGARTGDFEKHPASQGERTIQSDGLPKIKVSFAPHKKPTTSLDTLLSEIKGADSSVIFAVMDLTGGGDVLKELSALHADKKVFSYGISDKVNADDNTYENTQYFDPTKKSGEVVYSKENPEKFPAPFSAEREVTGIGHIVHHKFVVVDFNDTEPVVFCGSSNLAEGGEESNGDNLIAIYDRAIATVFAIEGIRLVDHYAFAAALKNHADGGSDGPLALQADDKQWWARYYVADSIKQKERLLFSC
jgi:phosphatidylserine/phosphatidylglycerophosphate/cardiolipin synthase-like enzyme